MFHFLGKSLPKLKLVTMLYCCMSSRLRSLGPCSSVPNPMVLIFPVAETVAKSAIFPSIFTTAAIPPWLSMSDKRNSLNQTSPLTSLGINVPPEGSVPPVVLFFIPTIKVLTNPKFGFPRTPSFNLAGRAGSNWFSIW